MTTSSVKVNENNDIFLDDFHNVVLIEDLEACTQDVRLATLMRTGEDVFDVRAGVGYFEFIFSPQQDYDAARKSLSDAIMSSPSVISVEELLITIEGEVFTYTAQVMTIYGQLTVRNV